MRWGGRCRMRGACGEWVEGGESNGIREEGWVSPTAVTAHLMLVVVRRV